MPVYRIAELNIKMEPEYAETIDRLVPYLTDGDSVDFEVERDAEGFAAFEAASNFPDRPDLNEGPYLYTKICKKILGDYDGFFFHSSALALDGEGYLFTALSGTGKSTHTRNWRKLFGERVTMINDDKPIIRRIDGRFFVCGTPWMGKSDIGWLQDYFLNRLMDIAEARGVKLGGWQDVCQNVEPATLERLKRNLALTNLWTVSSTSFSPRCRCFC